MNTTATYSDGNGTAVTFRKSLRNQMIYNHLRGLVAPDLQAWDYDERRQFAWVAAHVQTVKGLEWQPPQPTDTTEQLEASYLAFVDALPDYDSFNELNRIVNALYAPVADAVQRPDDTLTKDEHADPN